MNKKAIEFFKSFFGAFIGIIFYETVFDFEGPFEQYWVNYVTDILLMGSCIILGIIGVNFVVKQFNNLNSEKK